jgi:hypothetical protein
VDGIAYLGNDGGLKNMEALRDPGDAKSRKGWVHETGCALRWARPRRSSWRILDDAGVKSAEVAFLGRASRVVGRCS